MIDDTSPIPQSSALSEARADSISELFSRDPEGLSDLDLARAIEAYREQRVRWQAAEASGARKSTGPKVSVLATSTQADLKDLDL